jgi:hypothetical protein
LNGRLRVTVADWAFFAGMLGCFGGMIFRPVKWVLE